MTTEQFGSIFDGVELCDWPITRTSTTWTVCVRLYDHIHRQQWYLSGAQGATKWSSTGTRWYLELGGSAVEEQSKDKTAELSTEDSRELSYSKPVFYCQIRLFGIALALDGSGATTFKASSAEEAIRIYGLYAHAIFDRKFDDQIRDLLKRAVVRE